MSHRSEKGADKWVESVLYSEDEGRELTLTFGIWGSVINKMGRWRHPQRYKSDTQSTLDIVLSSTTQQIPIARLLP
jgi:hypothetical protein